MSLDAENKRVLKAIGNGQGMILVGGKRVVVCPLPNNGIRQNAYANELGGQMVTLKPHSFGLNLGGSMTALQFRRYPNNDPGGGRIEREGNAILSNAQEFSIRGALGRITGKDVIL
jgi:hypothetical protein